MGVIQDIYSKIKQNPGTVFKWILFLTLIYFPIFADLDVLPLRIWDEARLAENAYEMNKYGNYIVTHIQGNPEMWSTKPPLVIWLQVLCMKIVGAGELAVRLPSAISAFLTCLLIMIFSIRFLKSFWWGFCASLVMVTAHGYMWMHAARSGDYDVPMTLFITLYCLSFYTYIYTKKEKYITITFIGLILATFAKGIGGLLFVPALGLFAIIKGILPTLLRKKVFYINLSIFFILVIGYYLIREHYNPGYIKAVSENELGGRFLSTIENHHEGFWFYYNNFINFQFSFWYLLLPAGIVIGAANNNAKIREFILFNILLVIVYFLIISSSKTKLTWYDVPLYPFIGFIIGGLLNFFLGIIGKIENSNSLKPYSMQFLALIFVFFYPYKMILNETYKPDEYSWDVEFYQIEHYLEDAVRGKRNLNDYHLCYKGYTIQDLFYTNMLNDKGEKIDITEEVNFKSGDKILVCQKDVEDIVINKYSYTLIEADKNVKAYQINGIK